MIANGIEVKAHCEKCVRWWDLDLKAIAAKRGPNYTLVGRRLRCGKGHNAAILCRGPQGFMISIHASVAGDWSEAKRLQARCGWCGKGPHG